MFNQIILLGRLCKEPQLFKSEGKIPYAIIRIAVNRGYRNKLTNKLETDYFNVSVWNSMAESVVKNCKTGSLVMIKGRIEENVYEKDGKKNSQIEVIAEKVVYVSPKDLKKDEVGEVEEKIES